MMAECQCLCLMCTAALLGVTALFLLKSWLFPNRKQYIRDLPRSHVLITGGSSGIGLELAKCFHTAGAGCVTLIARREDVLQSAVKEVLKDSSKTSNSASSSVVCLVLDVSAPEAEVKEKLQQHMKIHGPVNILINCAGFAIARKFVDTSLADFEKLMKVNYLGAVNVTKAVVESMIEDKKRAGGSRLQQVCFVSSVAGQMGVYGYTGYSASKFALRGFAETLAMELRPLGIGVTLAFPPDTDTPGFATENVGKPEVTRRISAMAPLSQPRDVAEGIFRATMQRRFFGPRGLDGALVTWATCGFSWPDSLGQGLLQVAVLGPVRLFSLGLTWYFNKIVTSVKD